MAVRILTDAIQGYHVLYCSTTMQAFGPIFYEDDDVEDFLEWYQDNYFDLGLAHDVRLLSQGQLDDMVNQWKIF